MSDSEKNTNIDKININWLSMIYLTPNGNPYKIREN